MNVRLEGRTCILAALEAGKRAFEAILTGPGFDKWKNVDVLEAAKRRGVPVRAVGEAEFAAQGTSHGGLAAIAGPKPPASAEELASIAELGTPAFFIVLEGADDPRNLGYVLRTAEALGVQAALLRRKAWDFDSTAVSRASSGAFERLPVALIGRDETGSARADFNAIKDLKKRKIKLIGCVPQSRRAIYDVNLKLPIMLAIGGEKRGLSAALRDECDALASIPTAGGATSLAMTQAAAIVIAEAARQRRA